MSSLATDTTQEPDMIDQHISWLYKEDPQIWLQRITTARINSLNNILTQMDTALKSDFGENGEYMHFEEAPNPDEQLFSYFFSSKWIGDHLDGKADSTITKTGKPFNIVWAIVKEIINSDIFLFEYNGTPKKIFFENGAQKVYFYTQLASAEDILPASAAADVPENDVRAEWIAEIFLARRIITRQLGNMYMPLKKDEPMIFGGGWIGQTNGKAKWQKLGEKLVFGLDLDKFTSTLPDDLKPRLIEIQNILTVMLLLEHELIHTVFGIYRQDLNYDPDYHARLAKPSSFPRFYPQSKKKKWPKSKKGDLPHSQAFTDANGHGEDFSHYTNLVYGFPTQLSPLDYIPIDETPIKQRVTQEIVKTNVFKDGLKLIIKPQGKSGGKRRKRRKRRTKKKTKKRSRKRKKKRTHKRRRK